MFSPHFHTDFGELTMDAAQGLHSVLCQRLHTVKQEHKEAVNVYSGVAAMERDLLDLQVDTEEWDGFTSPESEDED